jgi:hypothetical protein
VIFLIIMVLAFTILMLEVVDEIRGQNNEEFDEFCVKYEGYTRGFLGRGKKIDSPV